MSILPSPTAAQQQLAVVRTRWSKQVSGPTGGYGWATGGYTYGFNNLLNHAFSTGASVNVTVVDNLASSLAGYSAVLVELGDFGPEGALSPVEAVNLAAFVASGKRVVIFGENFLWNSWNASFLGVLGASNCSSSTINTTPAVPLSQSQPLTAGVTTLAAPAPGCVAGGSQLFTNPVASLLGPSQNVLALMDIDAVGGSRNPEFQQNVATWLVGHPFVVTPEPTTIVLLGTGLIAIGLGRYRVRRTYRSSRPSRDL
ncbi:MAG: PEP-CTERM sorting domain-containing protein [Gemmatimonadales bacterium]